MRMFIAILPGQSSKHALAKLIETHLHENSVKWVAKDNLHITLRFLGEVAETKRELISEIAVKACESLKHFSVTISGVGAFPSEENPKVIKAGIADGAEKLAMLTAGIETGLRNAGYPPESRAFDAHITLGRVREGKKYVFSRENFILPRTDMAVSSIVLMKSVLSRSGPAYSILETFPLK